MTEADTQYLSDNIGGVLAKALGEMVVAQPSDGVAFLAQWLKVYASQEEAEGRRAQEEAELKEARAKAADRLEVKAKKKAAIEAAAAEKKAIYEASLKKFSDPATDFADSFWSELVATACTLAETKAAYLGLVDDDGLEGVEGPLIRYTEASADAELMNEKVLLKEQGVSWGAVTENPSEDVPFLHRPPLPEPVEADPANPDDPPPEPPAPPPYMPVYVPCVTDVKEVLYFDMTRLGAYLAVPIVYTTYHTPEAHAQAKAFEEEKKAAELKYQEALAEYQEAFAKYEEAVAEAEASGGEAPEKPAEVEKPEEKPLELPGKTVKRLLCIDTLGSNEAIEESKIDLALALCKAIGKCKEETEKRQVDAQALRDIDEVATAALSEAIEAARAKAGEETQEDQAQEEANAADDAEKEILQKKWAYLRAARVFAEMQEEFLKLTSWVVVPPEMLNVIASAALMFGYQKADLYPKRKPNLAWETLVKILNAKFFAAIQKADVAAPRKGVPPEQRLAAVKAMVPEGFDAEKAKALSPALELLHAVLDAAIAYRTSVLMAKKAKHQEQVEAASAEVEEGQEAPPMPSPLEDEDDDFEGLA